MKESDINIVYVIQAYNRPYLLAPSLLTLRDQIISRNRRIILLNDGPKTADDCEKINANKMVFESFFAGYPNAECRVEPTNNGAEPMFIKTFFQMFDDEKVDCFALLEDDLYYEHSYLNNVEKLLAQTYEDTDVVSVSGFTRQTIFKTNLELEFNRRRVVAQHNLIGAIYKNTGWPILRPVFLEFLDLKRSGVIPEAIFLTLNSKYGLKMPHTAYDKIVDHLFAKHRKLRVSTFNRYLFHMGLFGTSCAKNNADTYHNREALANFIRFDWNRLTTDSSEIDYFLLDKTDDSFTEQFRKEA
jgi:hypothetical protein